MVALCTFDRQVDVATRFVISFGTTTENEYLFHFREAGEGFGK